MFRNFFPTNIKYDLSSTTIQMIENDTEDSNSVAYLNNCHLKPFYLL